MELGTKFHQDTQGENHPQLALPLMRSEENLYADEQAVVIYGSQLTALKKKMPYDQLLTATQAMERELREKKKQRGVAFIGCGLNEDGPDTVVAGGHYEHVLEHALLAVLETKAPLNEQGRGLTAPLPHYEVVMRRAPLNELAIRLLPPPSMSIDQSRKIVDRTLKLLRNSGARNELDLQTIAEKIGL